MDLCWLIEVQRNPILRASLFFYALMERLAGWAKRALWALSLNDGFANDGYELAVVMHADRGLEMGTVSGTGQKLILIFHFQGDLFEAGEGGAAESFERGFLGTP